MSDSLDFFDPEHVNLTTADPTSIICFLSSSANDYDGRLGARISALFVILVTSSAATFFPVVSKRVAWLKVPLYVYLFARYFGAGVIIATAFIHLLDPAYSQIGPASCVGMTGGWAEYSWCPAIVLTTVMMTFLMDFGAAKYVQVKYGGNAHEHVDIQDAITSGNPCVNESHESKEAKYANDEVSSLDSESQERSFRQQIAAFLILEFGVIFHSVTIGLNLGVVGEEFNTLYPVLVFHQAFEGLGIGARMSTIPFRKHSSLPWILCSAYGLTTPTAIAIGLGLRTTYNPGSFTAMVVSGVLDSISAGILIYTGLVELLARDFLFNPERVEDSKRIIFSLTCVFLGASLMCLLGKWA